MEQLEWREAAGCKIGIHAHFTPSLATPPIKCAKEVRVMRALSLTEVEERCALSHDSTLEGLFARGKKTPALGLLALDFVSPWLAANVFLN